ncbi:MAG TPA: ABC transporter substrate-binding protein [Candidatus Hydrogenedentes bacterium]|nr:ABC transporter substrate-binding protein [Candidatus Hydrogenedentota bacterium]HQE84184.1 ABC transporter substrate-binding protein [Candidatus Hydrogenedentota bacterium]HQH54397.1 ABC transporter substrate-binding protein [Candidatus Hydrogenedentota bacterium]HQM47889.1 ABC transporter substrate-binding protein [Candidatus Hydrogenedentota bacterium]
MSRFPGLETGLPKIGRPFRSAAGYAVASVFLFACCLLCVLATGCRRETAASPRGDGNRAAGGVIRVDLNVYNPGTIPSGIGEPNKVSAELAEEWQAKRKGPKIRYQPLINTGSSEGEWLKTQLIGGVAPEIIHMNAEIAWPDVGKGWYVALDPYIERPNPYVEGNKRWFDIFSNQDMLSGKRAPDGKLYCIPLDIVETGVFYNKDLFAKAGITEFPQTWDEMEKALGRFKEMNIIPMTSGGNLGSDWGQDIIFEMLYHNIMPDLDLIPSRPDAESYLGHYLEPREAGFLFTKGFFSTRDPRWREMNRILLEWRGYWAKELKNSDPLRLFVTQRLATLWDGSWSIRRMVTDPYIDFQWGIAYIPTITQATSPYASGSPASIIGGGAVQLHVSNSAIINGNLEDCIDYLMFLTAPRNIERLASEALVFIPNIKGAKMDPRLKPFNEIFQRQRCAVKWLDSFDGEYKKYWRRMLDYYLNGGVELDEFLVMLEGNFAKWVEAHRGEPGWDFAPLEEAWKPREAVLVRELKQSG